MMTQHIQVGSQTFSLQPPEVVEPFTLSEADYNELYALVFTDNYPGYTPETIESPNGDGNLDSEKRYAHIALKYLDKLTDQALAEKLFNYLLRCHHMATAVAKEVGVDDAFLPDIRTGALRILDYPPGSVTHPHTDFNLFTLMMYRDNPEYFHYLDSEPEAQAQAMNHQIHMGEIYEKLGLGKATRHEVVASDKPQRSIVYFALPSHEAKLPDGQTVGEWLEERMSRSRYDRAS
jgi:hypothetical protein